MSRRKPHKVVPGPFGTREELVLGTASWLMALCGLWLLGATALDFMAARRAEAWPTVEGTVTALGSRQVMVDRFLPWQTWLAADYEYRVDSMPHRGSRVVFGGVLPPGFDARQLAAGSRVTVHYNPLDPAEAVLFPGGSFSFAIYALVGLFFVAVGLGLQRHLAALRRPPARPPRRRRAAV